MLGGEVHTKQQQTEERKKTEQNNPERARGWAGWREEWGRVLGEEEEEEEAVKKDK